MLWLTFAALVIAVVSAAIGYLELTSARSTNGDRPDPAGSTTSATTPGAEPTSTAAGPRSTYLDTMGAQTGGADLVPSQDWPTAVQQAGLRHPVVIRCPSNETGETEREVTYALNDRYRTLSATIRPHYTADREATTYVTVMGGFRQRDGVLTRREVGRQVHATMSVSRPLTAEVRDADEITIKVQCESPDGMIILDNAHVTRA